MILATKSKSTSQSPKWPKLRHHPVQQEMIRNHYIYSTFQAKGQVCPQDKAARITATVAGRGSGKTDIERKFIITQLPVKKPWPDPIFIYALPTYAQAKRVAWEPILSLIPKNWVRGVNVQDQTIKTIFGSTLYIVGLDKPHRIEGLQIDGIVIDESSDQKMGIFDKSIRPMLTHRNGWAHRIGVPKRHGIGRPEFKQSFDRGKDWPNSRIRSFWWESEDILSPERIAEEKEEMSEEDYEEQYKAKWIEVGGGIYYAFSEENVSESVFYDPSRPLLIGCDFNVAPMAWVIAQEFGVEGHLSGSSEHVKLHVIDEIFKKNTNTEATLVSLRNMYPNHNAGWEFYGDATARSRDTAAVKTDYIQIKRSELFADKKVFFPIKNPHLVDRWNTTNARLKNANGVRRVFIHPRCKNLIRDLESVSYKEGSRERENYDGTDIGHVCDAFDYLIYRRYRMRVQADNLGPNVITIR